MRSREFTVTLDPVAKERLERELQIDAPYTVKFTTNRQNKTYGRHNRGLRLITVHLGVDLFQHSSLLAVKTELLDTLLHEYRHAHQHSTWPAEKIERDKARPYWKQDMERDAREWARLNVKQWFSLLQLRPKGTRSRLARISAAERSVR